MNAGYGADIGAGVRYLEVSETRIICCKPDLPVSMADRESGRVCEATPRESKGLEVNIPCGLIF